MRLFVGVFPPAELSETLRAKFLDCGWPSTLRPTAAGDLHVTLKFLGEISDGNVSSFRKVCAEISQTVRPFEIRIRGGGAFPSEKRATVIWAGIEGDVQSLKTLAGQLEIRCRQMGGPVEDRPFRPHLTLARVGRDVRLSVEDIKDPMEKLKSLNTSRFLVQGFHLVRSHTGPVSSRYEILEEYRLQESARS